MLENSDHFAILPGGIGTYDEFFEVLAWKQVGQAQQNIGLLNIGNFFDPLINLLDHGVEKGFIRQPITETLCIKSQPEDLINSLTG
jgi:hypothetical protein